MALVFAVNGRVVRLDAADPTVSLATFVRENQGLTGTKVGCGEGGCGACTVLLSRWDADEGRVVSVTANACLRKVATLHRTSVVTVEGLGSPTDPNPLQKRFSELNASQCGFCTPGWSVAISGLFLDSPDAKMADIEDRLDGNLCRCTGYRPIVASALSFAGDSDIVDTIAACDGKEETVLENPVPLGAHVQAVVEAAFPEEFRSAEAADSATFSAPTLTYHRVTTPDQLYALLSAGTGQSGKTLRIVCSQTSAGVYKEDLPLAEAVVDISGVAAFRSFTATRADGALSVTFGATLSISELIKKLHDAAPGPDSADEADKSHRQVLAALARTLNKVANEQVRHVASIAGNITMAKENGFASDTVTPLAALGSTVHYTHVAADGTVTKDRSEPLASYVAKPTAPGEHNVLTAVSFAVGAGSHRLINHRSAIRCVNAHAIVNSAFFFELEVGTGVTIKSATAAFGNVGVTDKAGLNAPQLVTFDGVSGKPASPPTDADGALGPNPTAEWASQVVAAAVKIEGTYKPTHRARLVRAFTLKAFTEVAKDARELADAALGPQRPMPKAKAVFSRPADLGGPVHSHSNVQVNGQAAVNGHAEANGDSAATGQGDAALKVASLSPIGKPIPRPDGIHHACGTAQYTTDVPAPSGALFAAFVNSPIAQGTFEIDHAKIEAAAHPGFVTLMTYESVSKLGRFNLQIPQAAALFGLPLPPTPLWAKEGRILWIGEPIGIVVAETQDRANAISKWIASHAVTWKLDDRKSIFVTLADVEAAPASATDLGPAAAKVSTRGDVITLQSESSGDIKVVDYEVEMATQLHWYLEPHSAMAFEEAGKIVIYAQTQMITLVGKVGTMVLGRPESEIQAIQLRIGGSFGSKANMEHPMSVAIAASLLRRPVKMIVDRGTDSTMQGGREEALQKMRLWFDGKTGKIYGADARILKAAGHKLDLSFFMPSTLAKTHFSCYFVPNYRCDVRVARLALPSRTAMRGPGEIEGCWFSEVAIDRIAHEIGVHSQVVRDANLFTAETLHFPAGVTAPPGVEEDAFTLRELYENLLEKKGWRRRIAATQEFNAAHKAVKRGAAVVPFRYFVNPLRSDALVNIYGDGSVVIHHSGTEMGQGLAPKIVQAAAMQLQSVSAAVSASSPVHVPLRRIRTAGNDTSVVPFQAITGGSMGSEAAVMAVIDACKVLLEKITAALGGTEAVAKIIDEAATAFKEANPKAKPEDIADAAWRALIKAAEAKGVPMSAVGSTDGKKDQTNYSIWCVGAAEVEVDVMTGETSLLRFDVEYDAARSLNPAVDLGQVEGALVMGLGYMLQEDAGIDKETGALAGKGTTWEYKIPIAANVPREFNSTLIQGKFSKGVLSSKASGEPPLCVAPAATSAVHQCVQSALADKGIKEFRHISVPYTSDKIAAACSA
ncbi:molybdopterin binding aldehyde oxidase/xanthine dehydrogenase [Hyaloraphidium curvatum]|nr:molybdopterin binding aldehyde oxidase/xanthine dehydrogenase [Hyaloraphidium curvatum]